MAFPPFRRPFPRFPQETLAREIDNIPLSAGGDCRGDFREQDLAGGHERIRYFFDSGGARANVLIDLFHLTLARINGSRDLQEGFMTCNKAVALSKVNRNWKPDGGHK